MTTIVVVFVLAFAVMMSFTKTPVEGVFVGTAAYTSFFLIKLCKDEKMLMFMYSYCAVLVTVIGNLHLQLSTTVS